MSIESTPPDAMNPPWRSLLTQHLGLLVSAMAFGLISIRVLGVAKFDVVTALAIVQAGGAGNVAIGSVLASVSTAGILVVGMVGNSIAVQFAGGIRFTPQVLIKIAICIFASLFVPWWIAVGTLIFVAIIATTTWWVRMMMKRRLAKLADIATELAKVESEGESLKVEMRDIDEKRSRVNAMLERIESKGDVSPLDAEEARSLYREYKHAFELFKPKIEKHIADGDSLVLKHQKITSTDSWIKSSIAWIKSKFQKNGDTPQPEEETQTGESVVALSDADVQEQTATGRQNGVEEQQAESDLEEVESKLQEQTAEVREHQREVQQSHPALWPTTIYWILVVIPQVMLISTVSWLPTEAVTTKEGRPFAAYVLSQSDKELVLLRRDRGSVERLPVKDLESRQICRSSSGLWAKTTIGLAMSTPPYPKCPADR